MPATPYSQLLTDLLPLKIRSAGDPNGPTTAADHRAFEALEIEAISYLESMARGNRIFVAELFDNPPEAPADVLEGDLCLDRTGNLPLWAWVDGEWVPLGDLVGAAGAKILGGVGVPDPATGTVGDWYFRYNVAAYEKTPGGWVNRFGMGAGAALPDITGNALKYLRVNGAGTGTTWEGVPAGYTDNQAKDAALQAVLTTATISATYNTGTRLLSVNVRAASINMSHLDPAILASATLTPTQQSQLSTTANWSGKAYFGTAFVGVPSGVVYQDATYFFYFISDNQPIRMALV